MSYTSRRNWILAALGIAIFIGVDKTTSARTPAPAPLFERVASYTTTIAANRNPADIYYPQQSAKAHRGDRFPVALLLPGANVDKSNYHDFATIIASYGFVVVVPNQQRSLPQFGFTGLLPDTSQIDAVLNQIQLEKSNSTPISKIVEPQKLVLLGHSAGSAVGLSAIGNLCVTPIMCEGSFKRPQELVGGAFFAANLRDRSTQEYIPIQNAGIPIALIQGDRDGIALPERAQATYDNIQSPPKALITVSGANHYGIADTNNPSGAIPDPNTPQIEQSQAVETVARWSALFLRAEVLGDRKAFNYVYKTGDSLDKNVRVIGEQRVGSGRVGVGVGKSYSLPSP
jgi:predicted dienelactone hydrolase